MTVSLKIIIVGAVALFLTSCSGNSVESSSTPITPTDTVASSMESQYQLSEAGLNAAGGDCAKAVIAVNDVTDPDPVVQDAFIGKVASCIETKNPSFMCSSDSPDPVCVWDENAVKGPRVRLMESVYQAFKAAGDPYFQD